MAYEIQNAGQFTMTQTEAREAAVEFGARGYFVIAANGGGWSGGPRSQIWGLQIAGAGPLWPDAESVETLIEFGQVPKLRASRG